MTTYATTDQPQAKTLIPTFIGDLNGISQPLVNARDLHKFLGVETRFDTWVNRRIEEYQFAETLDFTVTLKNERLDRGIFGKRDVAVKNYHLSLDMAKELSMVERNDKGRQARRYFIACEKALIDSSLSIPDLHHMLIQDENSKLKQALLNARSDYKTIKLMYDVGLTNQQIAGAVGLNRSTVEKRLHTMRDLQLIGYDRGTAEIDIPVTPTDSQVKQLQQQQLALALSSTGA